MLSAAPVLRQVGQEHPLQEEEECSSQHRALNRWECSEPCTGPGWGCQELSWPLP